MRCFRWLAIGLTGLLLVLVQPGIALAADPAPDPGRGPGVLKSACDHAPDPISRTACRAAAGTVTTAAHGAKTVYDKSKDAAGKAAEATVNVLFSGILDIVRQGASWALAQVSDALKKISTPDVQAQGLLNQYNRTFTLQLLLLLVFFPIGLIISLLTMNGRRLVQVVQDTFTSLAFGLLAVGAVGAGVILADQLTRAFLTAFAGQEDIGQALQDMVQVDANAGVLFAILPLTALLGFVLYLEFLARYAVIPVATVVAPIVFGARVTGEWGQRLGRRFVNLVASVIFAEPLIAAVLLIGLTTVAAIPDDIPGGKIAKTFLDGAVLLLAILVPLMLCFTIPHIRGSVKTLRQHHTGALGAAAAAGGPTGALLVAKLVQERSGADTTARPALTSASGPQAPAHAGPGQPAAGPRAQPLRPANPSEASAPRPLPPPRLPGAGSAGHQPPPRPTRPAGAASAPPPAEPSAPSPRHSVPPARSHDPALPTETGE